MPGCKKTENSNRTNNDPCKKCRKTKCTSKNIVINGKLDVQCNTHLKKDLLVDGNLQVNDTISTSKIVLFDVPEDCFRTVDTPLAQAPLGDIPNGSSFDIEGLKIQASTGGPWYVQDLADTLPVSKASVDPVGTRAIICGFQEIYVPNPGIPINTVAPFDDQISDIYISVIDPTLKMEFELLVRNSSEPDYDFLNIFKNDELLFSTSGAGPSTNDPYMPYTLNISIAVDDILKIQFSKDPTYMAGVDRCYFYLKNMKVCRAKILGNITGSTANFDTATIGCIDNLQLQLASDFKVPTTDEIYDQYLYYTVSADWNFILPVIKEFEIPFDDIVPGTELIPGSLVYGYNDDQTLDVNGGQSKSYNPEVVNFPFRYHGVRTEEFSYFSPEFMRDAIARQVSYSVQRGWPLQIADLQAYKGHFTAWQSSTGRERSSFISVKFQYNIGEDIPFAVDLTLASGNKAAILGLYEPDTTQYKNSVLYPIRVPITQDLCGVFIKQYKSNPIAYYDMFNQKITIHIPNTEQRYVGVSVFPIDTLNNWTKSVSAFDGTFALLKRNSKNDFVSTGFKNVEYLAQASSKIIVVSGTNGSDVIQVNNFYEPGGAYTGFVLSPMNGGSNAFDVYSIINTTNTPATGSEQGVPFNLQGDTVYPVGDNPSTKLIEQYTVPGLMLAQEDGENGRAVKAILGLSPNVLDGLTYPEDILSTPLPTASTPLEAFDFWVGHSFYHYPSGIILLCPLESWATTIEMDRLATNNRIGPYRAADWVEAHTKFTRGTISICEPGVGRENYGSSLFWKYMAMQFDTNNQVIRRTMDILNAETAGPLFKANNITFLAGTLILNSSGVILALEQSLNELYGLDLSEVFNDFCISSVFLRNNTSIPTKYQNNYPYWIYQPDYPGYTQLVNAIPFNSWKPYADFWKRLDDNLIIPPSYLRADGRGQTFIRTLPTTTTENLKDLHYLAFAIPNGTTSVKVTITLGNWLLTVAQFKSDGTSAGIWNQDGSYAINGAGTHTFPISTHVPAYDATSKLCLICVNTTITDLGGLDNYFAPPPISGTIKLEKF